MSSRAILKGARVSPRKARRVADLIRGRDVAEALEVLKFTEKKSAGLIKKLVESAIANAEHAAEQDGEYLDIDELYIDTIFVDQGPQQRRYRPRAYGRATQILKRTSHITVVLQAR